MTDKNGAGEPKTEKAPKSEGGEDSRTRAVYDSLEKYIPAPLIATFIAINTFIPHGELDSFAPSLDRWIVLVVAALFALIMFSYLKWTNSYKGDLVRALIAGSIFFWCLMIAEQRFAGLAWWQLARLVAFLYVTILLLVLTLFEIDRSKK